MSNLLTKLSQTNESYSFYGVHNNYFKLGDTVFEAIEDENDGYRSHLDTITLVNRSTSTVFSRFPLANVFIKCTLRDDIQVRLVDEEDNHVWLEIGTDYSNDYYPSFIFHYNPKKQPYKDFTPKCPKYIYPEFFI